MDTQPWRFPEPPSPPRGAAARPANVTRPLTPREMAEKRAAELEQVEVAPGVAITVSKPVTAEKRQQLIDAYRDAAYNARGIQAFTSGAFTVEYPQRAHRGGAGLVVTQPPAATFTDGAEPKPVQELQTRLTTRGEAVLNHLLMTWADRANRPVVEPWMTLELRGTVTTPDDLPISLRPDEGGAYWLCGNEVYLWTGGRYRYVTLPPPDPPHVLKRVQGDGGETEIRAWGGDQVALPTPRRRVGDNPFSDTRWAAATELSAEDAAKQRRAMPEPTEIPAKPEAPKPLLSHRQYPITEFTAVCACPRCGWIDVHWLRPPELPQPEPEPAVIRECAKCQQEWGET